MKNRTRFRVAAATCLLAATVVSGQAWGQPGRSGGPRGGGGGPARPGDLGASKLDLGEPGIAWYTTWETAEAEAERSGRAIMFVAAATQCRGVSGVF